MLFVTSSYAIQNPIFLFQDLCSVEPMSKYNSYVNTHHITNAWETINLNVQIDSLNPIEWATDSGQATRPHKGPDTCPLSPCDVGDMTVLEETPGNTPLTELGLVAQHVAAATRP